MFSGGELPLGLWFNLGVGGGLGGIGSHPGTSSSWARCHVQLLAAGLPAHSSHRQTHAVAVCWGDFGNARGLVLGTSLHL